LAQAITGVDGGTVHPFYFEFMKYIVNKQFIKCVICDSNGVHELAKATQSELKKLYESHQDKIQRSEK